MAKKPIDLQELPSGSLAEDGVMVKKAKKKAAKAKGTRARSAVSGQFVTGAEARKHPRTTVRERVPREKRAR